MYTKEIVEVKDGQFTFNLFPKQAQFVNSDIDDLFFGGQVGPGKSTALLIWAAMRRLQYPGSNGILFRRSFRELEGSLILRSKEIYRKLGAVYNENKKVWTFPNGSTQFFGFCDSDGDVYQYMTNEYQDMGFDELTHFSQFQFNYLLTRIRASIPGMKTQVRSASNPGNIGNDWVKKRYILPYETSKIWTDPQTKKTMAFIPAKLTDNPALMQNDPGYAERLKDLRKVSEKKYLALAEGRWDQPEGTYFTEWSEERGYNVLSYVRTPDSYTQKILCMDWGFAEPACCLWIEITPLGRIFVYREYYGTRLSPKEFAAKVIGMCPTDEKYLYLAAPPEIWGKRVETENGGEVIQELIQAGLSPRIQMQKANNARIPGWLKVREYLSQAPDGLPWLQISPNCENLIRTFPSAIHDERPAHSEDISDKVEDHALDACFVSATHMLTSQGTKKLGDLVGKEGLLWTISGWERFHSVRKTRTNAEILEIEFSDGKKLLGTPDHELLSKDGWKPLGQFKPGEEVSCAKEPSALWKLFASLIRFRNSMASVITNADSIFKKKEFDFTLSFGDSTMDQSLLTTTSIMPTGIDSTTQFKISSFSTARNIWNITKESLRPRNWMSGKRDSLKMWFLPQESGIYRQRGKNGIEYMGRILDETGGKILHTVILTVLFAGMFLNRAIMAFLDFAVELVERVIFDSRIKNICASTTVVGIKKQPKADVYNLEVENVHCFSANGIIAHNCRYGISTLNSVSRAMAAPHVSAYEKIFGQRDNAEDNFTYLPQSGKGGYGR